MELSNTYYFCLIFCKMTESFLKKIRIVLVEPAGALNVGSIARVMKNMGLQRLVLVSPHCDPGAEEARKMAVHAGEILERAVIANSLPEALQGCTKAIATTARVRNSPIELEIPRVALPWLLEIEHGESALIFGPEDRGLSNQELNYAQRFVCIPANPEYPSLNLAQAVALCAYELYLASDRERGSESPRADRASATLDALEGYYQQLESVLLKIGYLYPHTAAARMEKFRRLFNRADLNREELAMLRGILTQVDWAVKSSFQRESGIDK